MAIGATRWAAFLLTPLLLAPAAATTAAADPMQQPSHLVGVWRMTGKGADGATVLRLGDGDAELYRGPHCRAGGGSWKALPSGQFGARLTLNQVDCVAALNGDDQLWNVVAFRVAGPTANCSTSTARWCAPCAPSAPVSVATTPPRC